MPEPLIFGTISNVPFTNYLSDLLSLKFHVVY